MTHMTPQEARDALDESNPGPWKIEDYDGYPEAGGGGAFLDVDLENEYNLALASVAPDLAATIAADTTQYSVEYDYITAHPDLPDSIERCYLTEDMDLWVAEIEVAKEALDGFRDRYPNTTYRLVARRVSPTWEVNNAAYEAG